MWEWAFSSSGLDLVPGYCWMKYQLAYVDVIGEKNQNKSLWRESNTKPFNIVASHYGITIVQQNHSLHKICNVQTPSATNCLDEMSLVYRLKSADSVKDEFFQLPSLLCALQHLPWLEINMHKLLTVARAMEVPHRSEMSLI